MSENPKKGFESPWFPHGRWGMKYEPSERLRRWRDFGMVSRPQEPSPPPHAEQDELWLAQANSVWTSDLAKRQEAAERARVVQERRERQRRQYEEQIKAAAQTVLEADVESLPVVESISAEGFLDLFGTDDEARFSGAKETVFAPDGRSLIEIVTDLNQPCGVVSCGFVEAGVHPDTNYGTVVLASYSAEEARRYIAWARAAELDCADTIYWLSDRELDRLEAMLPKLEARSLEHQAENLELRRTVMVI